MTGKARFAIGTPLGSLGATPRHAARSVRAREARRAKRLSRRCGQVAEWLKAADCKSARASVRWFESSPVHHPVFQGFVINYLSDGLPSVCLGGSSSPCPWLRGRGVRLSARSAVVDEFLVAPVPGERAALERGRAGFGQGRFVAFRSPRAEERGRPAFSQRSRNQLPKPFAVKGSPGSLRKWSVCPPRHRVERGGERGTSGRIVSLASLSWRRTSSSPWRCWHPNAGRMEPDIARCRALAPGLGCPAGPCRKVCCLVGSGRPDRPGAATRSSPVARRVRRHWRAPRPRSRPGPMHRTL